jgi:hypothetical protein
MIGRKHHGQKFTRRLIKTLATRGHVTVLYTCDPGERVSRRRVSES